MMQKRHTLRNVTITIVSIVALLMIIGAIYFYFVPIQSVPLH
ncbi:hypothetical protein [Lentilactobacillus parakefiri]|nr:hypothetical protein [Lentilactobacillus parakefiri]